MLSNLFIIFIVLALLYFASKNKDKTTARWMYIGAGLLAFWAFFGKQLASFFGANVYQDVDPGAVNSCGCKPGQLAIIRFKPFIGKAKFNSMPCATALQAVAAKPRRTSIAGCAPSV